MTEQIGIWLVASPTDPPLQSDQYQASLRQFVSELRARRLWLSQGMHIEDSVDGHSFLLGYFTVRLAESVGPVLGTIVGAWIAGRYGRRVRLKVGNIEAEAGTVEEVEKLMAIADKSVH